MTEQEFRVVELIGAGLANEQIAAELYVSINTVKTYVRTAYRKIGVTDRTGAILWAVRHGWPAAPNPEQAAVILSTDVAVSNR